MQTKITFYFHTYEKEYILQEILNSLINKEIIEFWAYIQKENYINVFIKPNGEIETKAHFQDLDKKNKIVCTNIKIGKWYLIASNNKKYFKAIKQEIPSIQYSKEHFKTSDDTYFLEELKLNPTILQYTKSRA